MLVSAVVDGNNCYLEVEFEVTETVWKKKHTWQIDNAIVTDMILEKDLLQMIKKELSNGYNIDEVLDAFGIITHDYPKIKEHFINN